MMNALSKLGGFTLAPRLSPLWRAAFYGALAALALPPVCLFPVLLICVPGLLRLLAAAPTRRRAFWIGYVFGFTHQLFGIYWITEAILVEAADYWWLVPFAVPLLAAILGIFTGLPCLVAWHARGTGRLLLAFAGATVLSDLAKQFFATGFPWNLWGSTVELPGMAGNVLIQIGALVGIHGMTLLIVLLAGAPLLARRGRVVAAGCFAVWIGYGSWRLALPEPPSTRVKAVLVQGNIPEGQKVTRDAALATFRHYLLLSRNGLAAAGPGQRALIWPETASPFLLGEDPGARDIIAQIAGPDTAALIGSIRFDGQTPYNSMFALAPGAAVAAVYDKWHLVPFGEYQPSWLPGIQLVPGSFGFGPGPRTLHVPGLPPCGPLICYEAAFSGQIVDRADRPAWFVNITNDAWFGNSSGPRQHLAAARMRTVEEGIPLIRAANTGITAGFDAKGRELSHLGLNESGFLVLTIPGSLPITLYARLGLVLPAIMAAACLLAGLLPFHEKAQ